MTSEFEKNVHRTLAYYEVFDHPLTMKELFVFFPTNSISEKQFRTQIEELVQADKIKSEYGLYYHGNGKELAKIRLYRAQVAHGKKRSARFVSHIIKRFPFVRGVFISGDISKGVAQPQSDLDYMIVTAPNRLWICRTLLIMFKKIFLLNSRKYFCLNYFISEDNLTLDYRNYFTATEVAHLKPIVNFPLFLRYLNANSWIKEYFPNYSVHDLVDDRRGRLSVLQKGFEALFSGFWADGFDTWLMNKMKTYWKNHYPQFDDDTRQSIFKCTRNESRAYAGNFDGEVLSRYRKKLKEYQVD
jgi:hypothetical protein